MIEFSIPTANSGPLSIASGPDGGIWFTEVNGNKIGRIAPGGIVKEFPTSGNPGGITAGPDGALWFTEIGGNKIGRITTSDAITEFPIPTANAVPHRITLGTDGNLCFTEAGTNKIGQITPSGVIHEFSALPGGGTLGGTPFDIVAGPVGISMWFTEIHGDKIGRITTTDHTTSEFSVHKHPSMITGGPDGALWFSESDVEQSDNVNMIRRITTGGLTYTEFSPPTAGSEPQGMTVGPDGALWFTEKTGNKIGRVTTDGHFSEFPLPTSSASPFGIVNGPDHHIWFTEFAANKIGVQEVFGSSNFKAGTFKSHRRGSVQIAGPAAPSCTNWETMAA